MLKLTQSLSYSGRGEIQQVQKLAPPIANTVEEVRPHRQDRAELSDGVLGLVSDLVQTEASSRPYSDVEILTYVREQGHDLSRRDVAYARDIGRGV